MFFAIFPVFILLLGLLIWAYNARPFPWADLGKTMATCGLLVLCFVAANYSVKLLPALLR